MLSIFKAYNILLWHKKWWLISATLTSLSLGILIVFLYIFDEPVSRRRKRRTYSRKCDPYVLLHSLLQCAVFTRYHHPLS